MPKCAVFIVLWVLFSAAILCESHCDFSITITIFFQQVQIERPDELQQGGRADFLGNDKVAQERINNSRVSVSARASIYSLLLCFYDYGSRGVACLFQWSDVWGGLRK